MRVYHLVELNIPAWLEALLPASVVAGSGLIGYGKLQARVRALEALDKRGLEDHDAIVGMTEAHRAMKEDITEIKGDIKTLLRKV
jgi:hypothetical protein